MGPVDVEDGFAIWINITRTICLRVRIVEASDLFVVFERPYVDVRVLTTHCQQRVVWTQRQASDIGGVFQGVETRCLLSADVINFDRLVHAQSDDDSSSG